MGFLILAGLSFLGLVMVDAGTEFLRQRKARKSHHKYCHQIPTEKSSPKLPIPCDTTGPDATTIAQEPWYFRTASV